MQRVTTTDKEEAIRTGKIFLSPEFYRYSKGIQKRVVRRCKYCNHVLGKYNGRYCDEWCKEQYTVKHKRRVFCSCGNEIFQYVNGTNYPKYCRECFLRGDWKHKKKIRVAKNPKICYN